MRKPKKRVAKKTAATTKQVKPAKKTKTAADLHRFKLIAEYRGGARGHVPVEYDHPFMSFGDTYAAEDDWRVVFSRERVPFTITPAMIDKAVPKAPKDCVIAQAFKALFGKMYDFQVGAGITKIWDPKAKIELRTRTAGQLSKAIPKFDRPPYIWPLPPNMYFLYPMQKQRADDYKARGTGKKRVAEKRVEVSDRVATPIRRKRKKKRATATRSVIRNSRIWLGK